MSTVWRTPSTLPGSAAGVVVRALTMLAASASGVWARAAKRRLRAGSLAAQRRNTCSACVFMPRRV
ncbi:Uncharacterised protein [Bordetella pertussis]|nr:Uncharacterised protein [Bordetella pertussis]